MLCVAARQEHTILNEEAPWEVTGLLRISLQDSDGRG